MKTRAVAPGSSVRARTSQSRSPSLSSPIGMSIATIADAGSRVPMSARTAVFQLNVVAARVTATHPRG